MTKIIYTNGEDFRWAWRFLSGDGAAVDFSGAALEARIDGDTACVTIPVETGPAAALGLAAGECSVRLSTDTLPLAPRLWAYQLELWATWSDGQQQVIDRVAIYIKEQGCA